MSGTPVEPVLVATNLCSNPSFETDMAGWTTVGGGLPDGGAVTTDEAWVGAQSLEVTQIGPGPDEGGGHAGTLGAIFRHDTRTPPGDWGLPFDPSPPPIVLGAEYTFSVYVTPVDAPHRYAHIRLRWIAAVSGEVIEERSGPTVLEGDDWNRVAFTTTAPTQDRYGNPVVGQALVWVFIDWWDVALGTDWPEEPYGGGPQALGGIPTGEVHYLDGLLIEQTGTLGPYFDGDTPDTEFDTFSWEATAQASISHRYLIGSLEPPPEPEPTVHECWPVDHTCCEQAWEDYPVEARDMADAFAVLTLRMLTAYRVGGCPITVRPCRAGCGGSTWATFPVGSIGTRSPGQFYPVLSSGVWLNIGCGCGVDGCSCSQVCQVLLPGDVGSVDEVKIEGMVLDPSAWRVDNGNLLTRVDGDCWPLCQRMDVPDTEPGTFAVTYTPGVLPDATAQWAAGLLACEYVKACTGGDCVLPPTVTQLVRQGATYDLNPGIFTNGLTGIRVVDAFILRWNPSLLKTPSTVWSPDVNRPRVPGTWRP